MFKKIALVTTMLAFAFTGTSYAASSCSVGKSDYASVKDGMTQSQVEAAVRCAGEETIESGSGRYKVLGVNYMNANGYSGVIVTYMGGKVASKAQINLK